MSKTLPHPSANASPPYQPPKRARAFMKTPFQTGGILKRASGLAFLLVGSMMGHTLLGPHTAAAAPSHYGETQRVFSKKALSTASFTTEQAERGAESYKEACAICHGAALQGAFETPALTGRFVANWSGVPLAALLDYMTHAMPLSSPGALSAEDNADILAFILRENGAPAGKKPLPASVKALEGVRFPSVPAVK